MPCLHNINGRCVYEFVSGSGILIISDPQFSQRYTRIQHDMFSTVTADEFWFLTRWDMHTQMLLVHAQVTAPNRWFSAQTDSLAPKQMLLYSERWFYTQTGASLHRQMVLHPNKWFCTHI
jgi:hypothetical protein